MTANREILSLFLAVIYGAAGVFFFQATPWSLWPSKLGIAGFLLMLATMNLAALFFGDRAFSKNWHAFLGCLPFAVIAILAVVSVVKMLTA